MKNKSLFIFFIFVLSLGSANLCFAASNDTRFANLYEPNPLRTTEEPGIYIIKPYIGFKETLNSTVPYAIKVKNKTTKKLIAEYSDVVYDGQGLSGYNGFIVPEDYTFITKGCLQFIVKADSYEIEITNDNVGALENVSKLKTKILILEIICGVLFCLLFVVVIIFIIRKTGKKLELHQNQILQIQEEEKSKISREIHDTVVQDLRAIRIEAEAIQTDDLNQKNRVVEDITKCIIKMRNICYDLSPAELADAVRKDDDEIDLISIIENLCKQFATKTNIDSSIQIDKSIKYPDFDKTTCLNVVRVFQEILNNINKHSYATKVIVLIKPPAENYLTIFVIDDGVGCKIESLNPKNLKNHFGIRNMRERMTSIGGSVDFFSSPDEGMKVVLKIKAEA